MFSAYILGAAVTNQMEDPLVSGKLMELANEIDSIGGKEYYDYLISLHQD